MLTLALITTVGIFILINGGCSYAESESKIIGPWWDDDDLDGSSEPELVTDLGRKTIDKLHKQYQSPATLLEKSKNDHQEAPREKENRRHRGKISLIDNHSKVLNLVLPTSNVRIPLEWTHWENTGAAIKSSEESQEKNKTNLLMANEPDNSSSSRTREISSLENLLGQHGALQTKEGPVDNYEESQEDSGNSRGHQISQVRKKIATGPQFNDSEKVIQHFPNPGRPKFIGYDTKYVSPQPGQHAELKSTEIPINVTEKSQKTIERNEYTVGRARNFQDSVRQHNESSDTAPDIVRAGENFLFTDQEKRIQHVPRPTQPKTTQHEATGWKKKIFENGEKPVPDSGFLDIRSQQKYQGNLRTSPKLPSGEQTMNPYDHIGNPEEKRIQHVSSPTLPKSTQHVSTEWKKNVFENDEKPVPGFGFLKQRGHSKYLRISPKLPSGEQTMNPYNHIANIEEKRIQQVPRPTHPKTTQHDSTEWKKNIFENEEKPVRDFGFMDNRSQPKYQGNLKTSPKLPSGEQTMNPYNHIRILEVETKPNLTRVDKETPPHQLENLREARQDDSQDQHGSSQKESVPTIAKAPQKKRSNSLMNGIINGSATVEEQRKYTKQEKPTHSNQQNPGQLILSNRKPSQNASALEEDKTNTTKTHSNHENTSRGDLAEKLIPPNDKLANTLKRKATNSNHENPNPGDSTEKLILFNNKVSQNASAVEKQKKCSTKPTMIKGLFDRINGRLKEAVRPAVSAVKELAGKLSKIIQAAIKTPIRTRNSRGFAYSLSHNKHTKPVKRWQRRIRSLINGFLNTVKDVVVDTMSPAVSALKELSNIFVKKQTKTSSGKVDRNSSNEPAQYSSNTKVSRNEPSRIKNRSVDFGGAVPKTTETHMDRPLQSLIKGFLNTVSGTAADVLGPAVKTLAEKLAIKNNFTRIKNSNLGANQKSPFVSTAAVPGTRNNNEDQQQSLVTQPKDAVDVLRPDGSNKEPPLRFRSPINGHALTPEENLTWKYGKKKGQTRNKSTQLEEARVYGLSERGPETQTTENPWEKPLRSLINGFVNTVRDTAADVLAPVKELAHKYATKEPLMNETVQFKNRRDLRRSSQKTPTSTTTVNPRESWIWSLIHGFLNTVRNTTVETLFGKSPKNPAETDPSHSSSNHQDAKGRMSEYDEYD